MLLKRVCVYGMYVCVCVHVVYVDVSMYCMYVNIDKYIHIWVYVYMRTDAAIYCQTTHRWPGHLCDNLKGIICKLFVHNMHNGGYGIHYGSAHRRAWNSTDEK